MAAVIRKAIKKNESYISAGGSEKSNLFRDPDSIQKMDDADQKLETGVESIYD